MLNIKNQMTLTKDDARVLFNEGVLSADSDMHKDAIKIFEIGRASCRERV